MQFPSDRRPDDLHRTVPAALLWLPLAMVLAGCADVHPLNTAVTTPAAYREAGHATPSAPLRPDWWRSFRSPELSSLVEQARATGGDIRFVRDPREAVAGAQVIVTDCWVSMGQPGGEAKVAAMQPYQVNEALMAAAAPGATFMHCLPAHRGEEVTDAVIDSPQSAVWDEAENRIHAQKSVLRWALGQL